MLRLQYDRVSGELKTKYRGYTVIKKEGAFEAAMVQDEHGGAEIYIGSHFEKYGKDVQEFILLHEIGHKELKHKNSTVGLGYTNEQAQQIYQEERLEGKYLNQEFEADEFAAKITGKHTALVALNQFKKKFEEMLKYYTTQENTKKIKTVIEEIVNRIDNIDQKSFDN